MFSSRSSKKDFISFGFKKVPVGLFGFAININLVLVLALAWAHWAGLIHIGHKNYKGGRMGEKRSFGLTDAMQKKGLKLGRLKTGTPPRLRSSSINWGQINPVLGDEKPRPFSFKTSNEIVFFILFIFTSLLLIILSKVFSIILNNF